MLQMHQQKGIYYSETEMSSMWDRWQRGESLQQIADLFDRHHSAIAGSWLGQKAFVHHRCVAYCGHCDWPNERRYRVVWLLESQFVRSLLD